MNATFVFVKGTQTPLVLDRLPRAPVVEVLTERWFEGDVRAGAELARLNDRPKIRRPRKVLDYNI